MRCLNLQGSNRFYGKEQKQIWLSDSVSKKGGVKFEGKCLILVAYKQSIILKVQPKY